MAKYDDSVPIKEAYKALGVNRRTIFSVAYNQNLAKNHNKGTLDDSINQLLIEAKTVGRKYLANFRDAVRTITGFRMPTRKVEVATSKKRKG